MRLRGMMVVLGRCDGLAVRLGVGLGVLSLGGCADEGSGACTTQVTPEVCETPANLRGAESVQGSWSSAPAPELVVLPLQDGRYVQTALDLYCPEDFPAPSEAPSVQAVTEIEGCVMRLTLVSPALAEPYVDVYTFRYGEGGTLDLTPACPTDEPKVNGRRYGFDGTILQFSSPSDQTGSDGTVYGCERIDSFELR